MLESVSLLENRLECKCIYVIFFSMLWLIWKVIHANVFSLNVGFSPKIIGPLRVNLFRVLEAGSKNASLDWNV